MEVKRILWNLKIAKIQIIILITEKLELKLKINQLISISKLKNTEISFFKLFLLLLLRLLDFFLFLLYSTKKLKIV